MEANIYLILILFFIAGAYLLDFSANLLNLKAIEPNLPAEFSGLFDKKTYIRSQQYLKENTRLDLVKGTTLTFFTIIFIVAGGFNFLDEAAHSFNLGEIPTGLIFIASLALMRFLIGLPFSIYETFVIEEQYGFNRTTPGTFAADILKGLALAVCLGIPITAAILWFFHELGPRGWIYCWAAASMFILITQFLAPVVIMPLFNKFEPLADGALKDAILDYASKENFKIMGIFTMDGSKRSSKLNAFFTGFGRFRRIVLFDTLIKKLFTKEVVAVLAHEMGHFKQHHVPKMMAASILQMGMMFWLLSFFIENRELSLAFGLEQPSIYASLVFFGFLYTPISTVLGLIFNYYSRQCEFEADAYAARRSGLAAALDSALRKLGVENLTNLTPHPWYVFLYYSHPPLRERLSALKSFMKQPWNE